jgi:hypothetical protein
MEDNAIRHFNTVVTAINYGLRYIQREKSEKKKF